MHSLSFWPANFRVFSRIGWFFFFGRFFAARALVWYCSSLQIVWYLVRAHNINDDYVMKHTCTTLHLTTQRNTNENVITELLRLQCFTNDYAKKTIAFTFPNTQCNRNWQKPVQKIATLAQCRSETIKGNVRKLVLWLFLRRSVSRFLHQHMLK